MAAFARDLSAIGYHWMPLYTIGYQRALATIGYHWMRIDCVPNSFAVIHQADIRGHIQSVGLARQVWAAVYGLLPLKASRYGRK